MALTTTTYVLLSINMPSDPNGRIDQLRRAAEAAVINYIKWDPNAVEDQVDYYDGNGQPILALRRPWVSDVSEVRLDPLGAYGQRSGSFGSTTVLEKGVIWTLRLDGNVSSTNYGKSGSLVCLQGNQLLMPSDLFYGGVWNWGWGAAKLSTPQVPIWPPGAGILKVTYDYGFAVIPDDLQLAVAMAVAIFNNSAQYGGVVTSESLARYSYSLQIDAQFGTVRQLLSRYRDASL